MGNQQIWFLQVRNQSQYIVAVLSSEYAILVLDYDHFHRRIMIGPVGAVSIVGLPFLTNGKSHFRGINIRAERVGNGGHQDLMPIGQQVAPQIMRKTCDSTLSGRICTYNQISIHFFVTSWSLKNNSPDQTLFNAYRCSQILLTVVSATINTSVVCLTVTPFTDCLNN